MKQNKFPALLVLVAAVSLAAGPARADVKTDQAIAKAEEQFAKGKTDDAIKSLTKLASGSPSVEAYLALAHLQDMNGSLEDAEASIAKAIEASASATPALKAEALAASANMAFRAGTGKQALEMALKAVAADKNASSLGTLASAHARLGDAKSAHEAADAAIAAGATSSVAHKGKGDALTASGQIAEAVEAYRKAVQLDPKNVSAHVGLAFALVAANKAAEAKIVAQKATELNKNSGAAFAALGLAISAEKGFNGNDPSWTDAIAQAQQGAFLAPKNPQVQVVVARLFEARGNLDQAKTAYQNALNADPTYGPARNALIKVKFQSGDLDGAIVDARELVKANPESAPANALLGEYLARKGEYKEAIPYLEKATAAMPNNGDAFAILAHSYHMTRSFEDGKDAYAKAVQLNPTNNEIKSNYGLLLGMSGEPEKGAQVLAALTSSPGYKSAAGFANYGWVLSRMKPPKAKEAIEAYDKAIALEPNNPGLYFGMAWAHYYAQDYTDAIADFQKACSLDKNLLPDCKSGIGWSEYFIAVKAAPNSPSFAKTKAALAEAEAAGHPDPRLAEAVAKYEKAVADGEAAKAAYEAQRQAAEAANDAVDVGRLARKLQRGSNQEKVDAAKELAGAGPEAAELLGYALETDPILAVRQEVVRSLQRMGGAARKALPYLQRYVSTQATPCLTNCSASDLQIELMESDLRNNIKALIAKLH